MTKGLKEKLGLNNENSECSFEMWLKQVHQAHVDYGMDTIYLMPNEDWSEETNIFFDHSMTIEKVRPWLNQLLKGVVDKSTDPPVTKPVCSYDIQNLRFSAKFLLASITAKFRKAV